jgi:hypothetical protein
MKRYRLRVTIEREEIVEAVDEKDAERQRRIMAGKVESEIGALANDVTVVVVGEEA